MDMYMDECMVPSDSKTLVYTMSTNMIFGASDSVRVYCSEMVHTYSCLSDTTDRHQL